jgi:cyclopropane-fatty-acyl-phospholipid synthase
MNSKSIKKTIEDILSKNRIHINGAQNWDIQVHNESFYKRLLKEGSLGLGESYMDGWWDCHCLDQFFDRVFRTELETEIKSNPRIWSQLLFSRLFNHQSKKRALEVGNKHYDLGNDLFKNMLDNRMNYTCAYWSNARNLDEAQEDKLELSCQKLKLQPGMRILDIGCGFGAFAKYAAQHYGVSVIGITISKEQYEYAQQNCVGLDVEIRFQDYRDVHERFERIISLGMFEHVGSLNYHTYMQKVYDCLDEEGLFLLHTIGRAIGTTECDPWINKYIFPNGMIPSMVQISKAAERLFIMENWANFGVYYDKTLMAWDERFRQNWDQLKSHYDERFYRMWRYYLLACAGAFRARDLQLWQIIFSKKSFQGIYKPTLFDGFIRTEIQEA